MLKIIIIVIGFILGLVFCLSYNTRDLVEGFDNDEKLLTKENFHEDGRMKDLHMLPLGGDRENGSHKGYGFAAIVDIMCSMLGKVFKATASLASMLVMGIQVKMVRLSI